ncbi:hypothetical protein [Amedibacillus sp. YH-ame10]
MKILLIVLVLALAGCSIKYDSSVNNLKMLLSNYCGDSDLLDKGMIFERNIPNIGYYAIAKVEQEGEEYLLMVLQNIGTKKNPDGFNVVGPIFYQNEYHIFDNEDKDYGHGKNYYLIVLNNKISNVTYDGKKLEIDTIKYTLNNSENYLSSFVVITDKESKLNKTLLAYE